MASTSQTIFETSFPNHLPALSQATGSVMQFIENQGMDPAAAYAVNLALEEMATNIIKYGYDDAGEHLISLQIQIEPDQVIMILQDDGHPFDPTQASPPDITLDIEERTPGGLGIHLVQRFAKSMTYERVSNKNKLCLVIARHLEPAG